MYPSKIKPILLALLTISLFFWGFRVQQEWQNTPLNIPQLPSSPYSLKVVLIPLDSRPPCTQFISQLAAIANIQVVLPPAELLDNYKTPGNTVELRKWLKNSLADADAAIISADMLIHGGLLASRTLHGTPRDISETIALLERAHYENPKLQLHVFSIIPRLLLADNSTHSSYQKNMQQYSVLTDQVYTLDNPQDLQKLLTLEKKIPPETIAYYLSIYKKSTDINWQLLHLAQKGVLATLVLGQDDGQPFGIPNIVKQQFEQYASNENLRNSVFITRGTDEVGLTLLSRIIHTTTGYSPKVYLQYSSTNVPQAIMPYMPHTIAQTIAEKISLAGGTIVPQPEQADFILYTHAGSSQSSHESYRPATEIIRNFLTKGYKVALVDLSENFTPAESLLPSLVRENVPIINLSAYAAWNTTSNSIGTSITQAVLFTAPIPSSTGFSPLSRSVKNAQFLTARFLDDGYYQKEVFPSSKNILTRLKIDGLNLGPHHANVTYWVQREMQSKSYSLWSQNLSRNSLHTSENLQLLNLETRLILPWPRNFEIKIDPYLEYKKE